MTTQKQIRAAFWAQCDHKKRPGGHNEQLTDVRIEFGVYVDWLCRSGQISEKLARRVTLG